MRILPQVGAVPGHTNGLEIGPASTEDDGVAALLNKHFNLMRAQSPAESCHVFPVTEFARDDVHLYALRENGTVLAIGALHDFGIWGELKSMHTDSAARGRGFATAMLHALIAEAQRFGWQSLKLETGSGPEHQAARHLYARAGFSNCAPFGRYVEDPLSVFMARCI